MEPSKCGGAMPPHKQPKSLFKIALLHVEYLVSISCKNIQATCGIYDENACQEQIKFLQGYLLSNIPGMVLDEVCEERSISVKQDLRISLAVYMHSNMRKFSVNNRTVDVKIDFDEAFWLERLSRLHNLVVLDLHLVCTDEILHVVGANCQKLEQINIVSKMEPVHITNETHEIFNALKLKFFVSDVGLYYLCNCKLLKKSLPYLQNITYDDMGLVISDEMEGVATLPLTHLSDYHPQPNHIAAASRLCSNLQHLCLQFPSQTSVCSAADVLESLALSDIRVSVLELIQFPFSREMAHLLEKKGIYLRSLLLLICADYISSSVIRLIGQSCPNLKNLHLKKNLGDTDSNANIVDTYVPCHVEQMFRNLRCLYIGGRDWNPAEVLPLCLLHAHQLETLTILQMFHQGSLDDVIAQVVATNPLLELKAVHMFTCQVLSMATIRYFFKNCPNLTELSFLQNPDITSEDVKSLYDEVERNNLDLKIYSMELDRLVA
ncbi:hypothetical protein C0J52_11853 [Blattella germanica]|nr:hypothetical protein C0J52_11853 [Blattella germanica]